MTKVTKSPKDQRAEKVDRIIRIAFDSLKTHLPYSHTVTNKQKAFIGSTSFHRKCVKDYAKIIMLATELY